MRTRAFVALGSNLNDPLAQIKAACAALSGIAETSVVRCSPLYRNDAVGPGRQPEFVNGVVELETGLEAHALLDALQRVESSQGRRRGDARWEPRIIDLDILLYGDAQIQDDRLTVPHPEMHLRRFVLQPLYDIAPALEIPGRGGLEALLKSAPGHGMRQIEPARGAE